MKPHRQPRETRRLVEDGLRAGLSRSEIADRLGLSKPTVTYHAQRLGFDGDARAGARYDWSAIRDMYEGGASMKECMERFGFGRSSWNNAVKRGDIEPRPTETPLEKLLVVGSTAQRGHLKRRLNKAGLKGSSCEVCRISTWRGRRLELHLHHINGIPDDNRLANLQVLCPNCHSQTPNYAGRNKG